MAVLTIPMTTSFFEAYESSQNIPIPGIHSYTQMTKNVSLW